MPELIVSEFVTLDGVMKAPGGEPDPPAFGMRTARRTAEVGEQHRSSIGHSPNTRVVGQSGAMAVTIYGVCAVTFMMVMYALESRGRGFVLAFAIGCVLSSIYGFLSGAWPFGVVELIWSVIAYRRFREPVET
jgi:hypothetical protein